MDLRPEILAARSDHGACHLDLRVPADLACFPGHFPDFPLLPGVVQLAWAVELGQAHFPLPAQFRRVAALKFRRLVLPGTTVTLELKYDEAKRELHFRYADSRGEECASGRFAFAAGEHLV